VERYNELSERGLRAGRALALARVLEDPDALLELVPRGLRKVLGARAVDISRAAVKRTLHKYGSDRVTAAGHERALCEVLDALRTGLARSSSATEPRTLFGELSYADLAMAQVLGFVDPPSSLRIARNNRHAFTDTRVAALYPDLIAWRNALYSAYRAAPHSP
jgi:glutathione S-transferase